MVDKTHLTQVIIDLTIYYVIFLPLCIWFIVPIYRVRKAIIMQKRFVMASIFSCICICIGTFIATPVDFAVALLAEQYDHTLGHKLFRLFSGFEIFTLYGAIYAAIYRFCMVYFEFLYASSLKEQSWKIQLNPKGITKKEEWIIKHRKTYGNIYWMRKRICVIWIITSSITFINFCIGVFEVIPFSTLYFFNNIIYLTPFIAIFILWCKMPYFLDAFAIRTELKMLVIMYATSIILTVGINVLLLFIPALLPYASRIGVYNSLFIEMWAVFIQTKYVLMKISRTDYDYSDFGEISQASNSFFGVHKIDSISRAHSISHQGEKRYLYQILENVQLFPLFMHHLSAEISTECIFAFIEFTQFRDLLECDDEFMRNVNEYAKLPNKQTTQLQQENGQNKHIELEEKQEDKMCRFATPKGHISHKSDYDQIKLLDEESIPLSHIVYVQHIDKQSIAKYKNIVICLGQKYIHNSADLCINISYQSRYEIMEWIKSYCDMFDAKEFELHQYCEMYCLFESSRREMYKLMNFTLDRFLKCNEFIEFMQNNTNVFDS
eukprot:262096_1